MLTDRQYELLQLVYEKDGIDQTMAMEIYSYRADASENLNRLAKMGFLEKDHAPEASNSEYAYFLTSAGKTIVEDIDENPEITDISNP